MVSPRITKVAKILVNHSCKIKKGEYVQIWVDYKAKAMALEVYKQVLRKGAYPSVKLGLPGSTYTYYKYATEEQLKHFPGISWYEIKKTDAVIYIGAPVNTRELSNVSPKKISMRRKVTEKISKWRTERTKWVIFDYPTEAFAQEADMSLEEFKNFVYRATLIDWKKLTEKQAKIKKVLDRGNKVRIKSKDTDITFSIKGRKAINSDGTYNMPDGEVFIAPREKTTKGYIKYTYPAIYGGREVSGVYLEFKKGKVVKAKAEKNENFLKEMIRTDEGAKYLGEFGIGTNPKIKKFIKNILFDEKIGGTIHLALGMAYKMEGGTNKSAIHWDMIKDLRKGGEVWIDKKLFIKDGKFMIKL